MPEPDDHFIQYLDAHLARRGWSTHDFARHAELSPSVVFRWRKGYRPYIDNARVIARTFDVSVLEVLVAAGQLTEDEAGGEVPTPPALEELPLDHISVTLDKYMSELRRRAHGASKDALPDATEQLRLVPNDESELQTVSP